MIWATDSRHNNNILLREHLWKSGCWIAAVPSVKHAYKELLQKVIMIRVKDIHPKNTEHVVVK